MPPEIEKYLSHLRTATWKILSADTEGGRYADASTVVSVSIFALLGTGMEALPAGFLASGFSDALESGSSEEKEEPGESQGSPVPGDAIRYCPHCGSDLDHLVRSPSANGAESDVDGS
jgi:hypothetical protein